MSSPAISAPRVKAYDWRDRGDRSREVGLLINATSLGMHGAAALDMPLDAACPMPASSPTSVYVPLETPLLAAARARGLATVDGLGMLLHQATPGFEKWFGVKPEVTDELRAIIVADIEGALMLVVGLTGSIGMGKSTVAARLRALGIGVCDADAEVHKLYEGAAVPLIEAAFPGTTADGKVDRQKLAAALLANPAGFKRLEAIVHPLVFEAERALPARRGGQGRAAGGAGDPAAARGRRRAPGRCASSSCSAPAEAQRARVMQRPGMTPEKLEQMLARQMSDADKRARADFVVDTGGTFAETDAQVDRIVESLQGRQGTAYAKYWA